MHQAPAPSPRELVIDGRALRSRLFVGTGKYRDMAETRAAIEASGAEVVTVAVRRVDLSDRSSGSLFDFLAAERYAILPNTAGCTTADEAVRTAHLARELGLGRWVKLEVIGDGESLYPDVPGTLEAAQRLVEDGFVVLPYTTDDPIVARRLEDLGCAAVMPLGAPIGSGLGLCNPYSIRLVMRAVNVPVIVDAGVGTASDAAVAMELGCDAVLMNTAIAKARDPVGMARAMRLAVESGRLAYESGRIPRKLYATASSPLDGRIGA